jgi:hypothetical protein
MQHPVAPSEEAVRERSPAVARNALGDRAGAAWLTRRDVDVEDTIELARTVNPIARTATHEVVVS